jgi:hypothetical protein
MVPVDEGPSPKAFPLERLHYFLDQRGLELSGTTQEWDDQIRAFFSKPPAIPTLVRQQPTELATNQPRVWTTERPGDLPEGVSWPEEPHSTHLTQETLEHYYAQCLADKTQALKEHGWPNANEKIELPPQIAQLCTQRQLLQCRELLHDFGIANELPLASQAEASRLNTSNTFYPCSTCKRPHSLEGAPNTCRFDTDRPVQVSEHAQNDELQYTYPNFNSATNQVEVSDLPLSGLTEHNVYRVDIAAGSPLSKPVTAEATRRHKLFNNSPATNEIRMITTIRGGGVPRESYDDENYSNRPVPNREDREDKRQTINSDNTVASLQQRSPSNSSIWFYSLQQ